MLVNGSADFRSAIQSAVLVVRIVMSGIKMAAYALEVELFLVLVIIQMGCDAVICNTFRKEVDVTLLA